MAYQSVGTPKFYIDYFSYWQTKGLIHKIGSDEEGGTHHEGHFIGLNPSSPAKIIVLNNSRTLGWAYFSVDLTWGNLLSQSELELINFCGVLGHDINKAPEVASEWGGEHTHSSIRFAATKRAGENVPTIAQDSRGIFFMGDNIINSELNGGAPEQPTIIRESGFSLWNCEIDYQMNELGDVDRFLIGLLFYDTDPQWFDTMTSYSGFWNLNSLVLGHTYKMPHSPDLKVTMAIDYDGVDSTDTTGGSTITNVRYTGAPKWNDLNAWQIGNSESLTERGGRRSWSLKFSHLLEKDLFSSNYMANRYMNLEDTENNLDTYTTNDDADIINQEDGVLGFTYTLADDDSFIARVLNYVGNGTRFIFQPDSNMSNPSDFAICVVDQDSIKITQVANNVYDISLKIREVW